MLACLVEHVAVLREPREGVGIHHTHLRRMQRVGVQIFSDFVNGVDRLELRVFNDDLLLKGLMQRDEDVLIDGAGDEEAAVVAVIRRQVGATATERDACRRRR